MTTSKGLASSELSSAIARWLAGIWELHRSEPFAAYVATTYGMHVDHCPLFDRVYIAEAESGDLAMGRIESFVKKWWRVDDRGLVEVCRSELRSTDGPEIFDHRPLLRFLTDGERIVLGERLGPGLICRKTGKVVAKEGAVSITDLRVVWTAGG
jgi:hypothetical protein